MFLSLMISCIPHTVCVLYSSLHPAVMCCMVPGVNTFDLMWCSKSHPPIALSSKPAPELTWSNSLYYLITLSSHWYDLLITHFDELLWHLWLVSFSGQYIIPAEITFENLLQSWLLRSCLTEGDLPEDDFLVTYLRFYFYLLVGFQSTLCNCP